MPQTKYDKKTAEDNLILRIANSTGINNFSDSSKIKLIAGAITEDISNYVDLMSDSIDNIFSASATNRYLDLKGAEAGVYRNVISSINIRDTDQIIEIRPRDADQSFGDIMTSAVTIRRGEEIPIGSKFTIVFTKDITFGPSSSDVFVSARIEVVDKNDGFSINSNDIFKIPTTLLETRSVAPFIEMVFLKGVGLAAQNESDASFRSKVLFARNNSNVAVYGAIEKEVQSLPGIKGYSIITNERGSSSIDIGITSSILEDLGIDNNMESLMDLLEYRLRSVIADGVDYEIYIPTPIKLSVEYSSELSETINTGTIEDAIYNAFKNIYSFSEENGISASILEDYIRSSFPSLEKINITSLSLFDTQIQEYISFGENFAYAPKGTFITLDKADIAEDV